MSATINISLVVVFIAIHFIITVNCGGVRKIASSISCYTCSSRNGTDQNCHDPFNPAMAKYVESCKVPKPQHIGVFPARFCVKVKGTTAATGEELVIRSCSIENMDNQCGNFKFEKDTLQGCILTCDYDGCNGSRKLEANQFDFNVISILLTIVIIMLI